MTTKSNKKKMTEGGSNMEVILSIYHTNFDIKDKIS